MDRLLTFAAHRDPFVRVADGPVQQREGLVLDLLQQRSLGHILVLETSGPAEQAKALTAKVRTRFLDLDVESESLAFDLSLFANQSCCSTT
ncbi:MAG: hypothetical protein AAF624_04530 [Bacteroidota bacterium]